jgi:mannose-6-phosphate isomerase
VHLPAEPLFFNAIFYETIWGGQRLKTHFNKSIPCDKKIGESWELAGFGEHQTTVAHGPLAGQSLGTIFTAYSQELMGEIANDLPTFPLLVKFIDAHDALSVQVHPNDRNARLRFGEPFGKTECWYIAHAGPNAALGIGFTKNISRGELRDAIATGAIERFLHIFPVTVGEVYFIPAGTVHAIMGDVVIYEIQQSSNTTLRMYDWQRTDATGKPRTLHIEDAVAVADLSGDKNYRITPVEVPNSDKSTRWVRVASPYFAMEEYRCTAGTSTPMQPRRSCQILSCMSGSVDLHYESGITTLYKGSTALLPAILRNSFIVGREPCICLSTFLPALHQEVVEPLNHYGVTSEQIAGLGDVFH